MPLADTKITNPARRRLPRLASLLAAVAGALYSYDFGALIGGPLVGLVLALNGAVFGSVIAGALTERLCRRRPGSKKPVGRMAG